MIDAAAIEKHRMVDTRSPDEARERISRIFCPHFLIPRERRPEAFHARHDCVRQVGYSVNFVAYGSEVEIDPGELSGFFLLQWPRRGSAWVKCGGRSVEAEAASAASVLSPTLPTRMVWREGCEKFVVLVERAAMQRHFEALTGGPARAVEFDVGLPMTSRAGHLISRQMEVLFGSVEGGQETPKAYQASLRDGLTSLMLCGLAHNQSGLLSDEPRAPAPRAVRRAEEFIEAHIAGVITMAEVAAAAGANLRSLQAAFKRARGLTLSEAVQGKRLERFHQRLSDPDERGSITEIAYSVGLGHLGRAAAAYRSRYGATPSQTLRARR